MTTATDTASPAATERVRVLVADDEPDLLELLALAVGHSGHQVVSARNGQEALELLRTGEVDVAVLDVQMPRMSGVEVVAALRALQGVRQPPVIMLSALDGRQDVDAGYAAGADDYLFKPCRLSTLRQRVDEYAAHPRTA